MYKFAEIETAGCAQARFPQKDSHDQKHDHEHGAHPDHHDCSRCNVTRDRLQDSVNPNDRTARADVKPEGSRTAKEASDITDFQTKFAVDVSVKGKTYEYKISLNGADKVLFTTDATAKGLEEAEKKMAELVKEKQEKLEKDFKVAFSKEGDDVIKQWIEKADCTWERGPMVTARSPQLIELCGIEAALYRSQPSNLDRTGAEGVKFHFLKDNYYKDQPVLAYYVRADKDGRPSVYFEPGANKDKPATEKDANRMNKHQLYSIEALTVHELNHNHQKKMGWHTPADKETLAKEIGWVPFLDPKTNETEWLYKGKKGELYRRGKDHCKDEYVWVKCNTNGEPLDDKDKPVAKFKDAKTYTRQQITDLALVPPITKYFVNPVEMFAEGLMMLRLDKTRRTELLKTSPVLYEAAKKQDQAEMNLNFGTNLDGTAKYIRNDDGLIVENSDANRKSVEAFEKAVKDKK